VRIGKSQKDCFFIGTELALRVAGPLAAGIGGGCRWLLVFRARKRVPFPGARFRCQPSNCISCYVPEGVPCLFSLQTDRCNDKVDQGGFPTFAKAF